MFSGFGFRVGFAFLYTLEKKSGPCLFIPHIASERLEVIALALIVCSARTTFQRFQWHNNDVINACMNVILKNRMISKKLISI